MSQEQVEEFARESQICMEFETSAKEDINVANTFEEIAKQIFVGYLSKRKYSPIASPKENPLGENQKKKCC